DRDLLPHVLRHGDDGAGPGPEHPHGGAPGRSARRGRLPAHRAAAVTRAPRVLGMLLVAVGALVHAAVQANANVPRSVAGNGGTVATGTGRMSKGTVGQAALGRGLGVGRTL